MRRAVFFLLFSVGLCHLFGDLSWSQDRGWYPSHDIVDSFNRLPDEAVALMNEARAAQEAGNVGTALSQYGKIVKRYDDTVLAPEAYYQIGMIRMSRNQFNDAFKAFSAIIEKYPEYSRYGDALHQEYEIAQLLHSCERPKYFGTIPGFRDYSVALGFYKKIVDNAPYSELAPLALLHMGQLAMSKHKTVDAIDSFERMIDEYPYSEYAPEAYFQLGEIYSKLIKSPLYDQGATKTAMHFYEDFLTLYPDHARAGEAQAGYDAMKRRLAEGKMLVGDFYFQTRNNRRAAVMMYKKAADLLPDSDIADLSLNNIEFIRKGNFPDKTPVDFLFGRYQCQDDEEWVDEAMLDSKDSVEFGLQSGAVDIGDIRDSGSRTFVPKNDGYDQEEFVELEGIDIAAE